MNNEDIIYIDDDIIFDDDIPKTDKIDVEEEPKNIYNATYSVFDKYNKMRNDLINANKEIKLSKIQYESLENKYKLLLKKYENEQQNIKSSEDEIKKIRRELIEKNKNVLMLKALLELIIKKYGMENISKITRLNEEQINRYLK